MTLSLKKIFMLVQRERKLKWHTTSKKIRSHALLKRNLIKLVKITPEISLEHSLRKKKIDITMIPT